MPITAEQWSELKTRYPHPARIAVAIELARDPEAAAALVRGEPVDPARLDRAAVKRLSARLLVRLDVRAIDLLGIDEEVLRDAA